MAPQSYGCKLCQRLFKTSRALGGHYSKAHAGQSSNYQQKMEKRKERTNLRSALALAKQVINHCNCSQQ